MFGTGAGLQDDPSLPIGFPKKDLYFMELSLINSHHGLNFYWEGVPPPFLGTHDMKVRRNRYECSSNDPIALLHYAFMHTRGLCSFYQ
jgi:hypothetical protein